jgi:hypothetical protein
MGPRNREANEKESVHHEGHEGHEGEEYEIVRFPLRIAGRKGNFVLFVSFVVR